MPLGAHQGSSFPKQRLQNPPLRGGTLPNRVQALLRGDELRLALVEIQLPTCQDERGSSDVSCASRRTWLGGGVGGRAQGARRLIERAARVDRVLPGLELAQSRLQRGRLDGDLGVVGTARADGDQEGQGQPEQSRTQSTQPSSFTDR
jgi:hypothetical protein